MASAGNMSQSEKRLLRTYSSTQLKKPFLVAAGPGTANVGIRTADYLRQKLGAELFADIEPYNFFTPPYSFAFQDGLIDIIPVELGEHTPKNNFYYWKSGKDHDIIIFTGDTHPLPGKVPELAGCVLEFARDFGIERLYMPGAFLTDIHHLTEPTIYGSATDKELREYLHSYNIADNPPMNIAHNLNAWLLGMAKKKGIDAVGLVSEIPTYKPDESNIRACRALVKILLQMLDIGTVDLSDLDAMLKEEDKLTERRLAELKESTDEKTLDFLHYLEMLEKRNKEISRDRSTILPSDIDLPPSLKFIEKLYTQAQNNHEKVQELRLAVQQLKSSERLLIMRKYGDEIMRLLDYQV
jgi:proteasome assembly chaperone (PAC2) family protein